MPENSAPRPEGATPHSVRLTDPRALRAYAHPLRMTLVGLLRRHGPFTATRAAELTGESVASCSYHLRILAKYGLVEEAPGGRGREKPWQATARYTEWPGHSDDPSVAQATDELNVAVAERYFGRFAQVLENRRGVPKEWREAELFGDSLVYLTPEELTSLGERIDDLLGAYLDREEDPAARPPGARPVSFLKIAYLDPDTDEDEE
ncbi:MULTISPECIES: winged helix-turn-helix domain-containing protein [unclassified Streptomyces]|uniref:winged helix-turn-helix domain-containing protein n=1 Tax=unclassified Streptomyces TaxID=2593676 RepID=UPI0036F7BF17